MKTNAGIIHRLPITKARVNLGQVARRVHLNKEYFILEKDGIPIIGIMGADELEDYLEVRDPKVREHIRKGHEDFLAGRHWAEGDLLKELKEPQVKKRTLKRS